MTFNSQIGKKPSEGLDSALLVTGGDLGSIGRETVYEGDGWGRGIVGRRGGRIGELLMERVEVVPIELWGSELVGGALVEPGE